MARDTLSGPAPMYVSVVHKDKEKGKEKGKLKGKWKDKDKGPPRTLMQM